MDSIFDTAPVSPMKARQEEYILDLRRQYDDARSEWCELTGTAFVPTKWNALPETADAASYAIEAGRAAVATMRSLRNDARAAKRQEPRELSEGMWIIGSDVATGRIFKVQRAVHGSGNLYAKELTEDGFVYVPGAGRQLATEGRKMTLEEAKAYGTLYGTCCQCGRTLTNEESIAAGIGPICASKF